MSSLFRSTLLCRKTTRKEYSFQLCCSDWFNNLSVDTEKHNFMSSKQRALQIGLVLRSTCHSCERMGFYIHVYHCRSTQQEHCAPPILSATACLGRAKPSHEEWDLAASSREMLFCSLHLHWRLLAAAVAQDAFKDDSCSIMCYLFFHE